MAHVVAYLLTAFAGIALAAIPALLILSGGGQSFERRLAASLMTLYFAAVTWGVAELLERLL